MTVVIETHSQGRWMAKQIFEGPNMMGSGRENFNQMLRDNPSESLRLIVVHADHNGTSESAAKLLR